MITSLKNILMNNHILPEETSYCQEQKELFDYLIVSGDFMRLLRIRQEKKKSGLKIQ